MVEENDHYLHKELIELFKNSEDTLEFVQEHSLDGMWFWDLENPDHEWMSPAFWKTLGFDPSEKEHLASEWQDLINPDDLKVAFENFQRHCEDPSHPYDQVVRYKHANGSTIWVRCRGVAIRDEKGKPVRLLGTHNDITALKEIEQRYRNNLKTLDEAYASTRLALEESDAVFNLSPDALIQVDVDGFIVRANQQAAAMFGYSVQELLSLSISNLVSLEFQGMHRNFLKSYFDNPDIRPMGSVRKDIFGLHKKGYEIPVEIRLAHIDTRFGKTAIASIRDVSETKALVKALQDQLSENQVLVKENETDTLTGVFNRRYFDAVGAAAVEKAFRRGQALSLLALDIDFFKKINDTYGHAVGDEVLMKLSATIQNLVRSDDVFARIGGEEFCMLLPHTPMRSALHLAERVRSVVEKMVVLSEGIEPISVTISIGVATLTERDKTIEALMKRADQALYQAKEEGRNRVVGM
jgi:diguanylate cyclase (GGDEF)-like protein/PAS domain S-box-containing protein